METLTEYKEKPIYIPMLTHTHVEKTILSFGTEKLHVSVSIYHKILSIFLIFFYNRIILVKILVHFHLIIFLISKCLIHFVQKRSEGTFYNKFLRLLWHCVNPKCFELFIVPLINLLNRVTPENIEGISRVHYVS